MRSSAASLARPSVYSSGSVRTRPASTSWSTSLSPRPSMSIARRRRSAGSPACAAPAQNRPPVQRQSTSPSSRAIALPHTGHLPPQALVEVEGLADVGRAPLQHHARPPRGSRRRRGARSPCRRCARPCGAVSSSLCSVALLTVVPPTNTGSSLATGVSLPVRPTWMSMSRSTRHLLLRRVLVRHRPARLARDEAEPLLQRARVDLVDHAVDVEGQRVALRAHRAGGRRPARRRPAPPRARR